MASATLGRLSQYLRNPVCGDEVTIQLKADGDVIQHAWFSGTGCMVSQAAASILCEHLEQRLLIELSGFSTGDMLKLVGIPLTPHRQQCALLPYHAVMQMSIVPPKTDPATDASEKVRTEGSPQ